MRTAGLAAMVMLVGTGSCAPAAVADKGGVPHDGSQGQGRQEQADKGAPAAHPQAAQPAPAKAAPTAPKPARKHHAKSEKAHPVKAKPAEPVKVAPAAPPAPAAPQKAHAKTTICHHTGSRSHPWVTITVSNSALGAHGRHGDLIPAPAAGCPKAAAAAQDQPDAGGPPPVIVTIPEPPSAPASPSVVETSSPSSSLGEVLAAHAQSPSTVPTTLTAATPRGRLLAARASAPAATAPTAVAAARTASAGSRMPYTGLMAWLFAVAGAGALLAGVALRRAHATRR